MIKTPINKEIDAKIPPTAEEVASFFNGQVKIYDNPEAKVPIKYFFIVEIKKTIESFINIWYILRIKTAKTKNPQVLYTCGFSFCPFYMKLISQNTNWEYAQKEEEK